MDVSYWCETSTLVAKAGEERDAVPPGLPSGFLTRVLPEKEAELLEAVVAPGLPGKSVPDSVCNKIIGHVHVIPCSDCRNTLVSCQKSARRS